MKIKSFVLLLILFLLSSFMERPAYTLFNKKGQKTKFSKLLEKAKEADVILFGELHNNPISHWLQLELAKDLKGGLSIGMEMFEADDQMIIIEYFKGKFATKNFESEVKLWNNYQTDYKPILEFAKSEGLPLIATNVPRRYANMVSKNGIESLHDLSDEAKKLMAPLPIEIDYDLPGYKNMKDMMGPHAKENADKFVQAQALKDATMAHFIVQNLMQGNKFLHLNGAYHSNNFEGIFYYLKKYKSDLKVLTISTVEQEIPQDLEEENKGIADFVINVPKNMTKTY
jgi:uncharacterized iron-regulated protein